MLWYGDEDLYLCGSTMTNMDTFEFVKQISLLIPVSQLAGREEEHALSQCGGVYF